MQKCKHGCLKLKEFLGSDLGISDLRYHLEELFPEGGLRAEVGFGQLHQLEQDLENRAALVDDLVHVCECKLDKNV